jgi:hypothetical protein
MSNPSVSSLEEICMCTALSVLVEGAVLNAIVSNTVSSSVS